ncbi:hypothetical protein J6590_040898, partial [Homalodisca vitripennis]
VTADCDSSRYCHRHRRDIVLSRSDTSAQLIYQVHTEETDISETLEAFRLQLTVTAAANAIAIAGM